MHANLAEKMSKIYTRLADTVLPQLATTIKGDCDKSIAQLRSEGKQQITELATYTADSTPWSTALKGHSAQTSTATSSSQACSWTQQHPGHRLQQRYPI